MKKKILFLIIGILIVCVVGGIWIRSRITKLYDVSISSNDLKVNLVLEQVAKYAQKDRIQECGCTFFTVNNPNEFFTFLKDQSCYLYSVVDGKRSHEISDLYVLNLNGYYFFLKGSSEDEEYTFAISRGVVTFVSEEEDFPVNSDFPFPVQPRENLMMDSDSSKFEKSEQGYFCPWSKMMGISTFEDLLQFYSDVYADYVITDIENNTIYFRLKGETKQLPEFVLEGEWTDYIGKMMVVDEGVYVSFSKEYIDEVKQMGNEE